MWKINVPSVAPEFNCIYFFQCFTTHIRKIKRFLPKQYVSIKIQVGELESENRKEGGTGVSRRVGSKYGSRWGQFVTGRFFSMMTAQPLWLKSGHCWRGKDWDGRQWVMSGHSHPGGAPFLSMDPTPTVASTLPSYLYESPGIPKNWCPLECFPRTGICPVALEYLLCIPCIGM